MPLKSVVYRLLIYKENSTNCYFSIYLLGWETLAFNYGQMNVFYYYENAKEQSIGFKRRCDKIANSRYSMLVSEGSNENTLRFVDYPSMVIISKIDNNIVMVVVADMPNNIMQNIDRYPELMKLKDTYDAFHDYHTY